MTTFYLEKHAPTLSDIEVTKSDGGDEGGNGGEATTTLANGETWLSRWCVAVGLHAEMVKALEHARDAYKAVVRAKARREDDRAAQEAAEKRELLKQCHKHGVDPALFPPDDPWGLFPWELQLRPKAEVEERLQKAIGLRQTARLEEELKAAKEMGLDVGSNTKVFAASELLALLLAEGAAMRRSNTAGVHDLGVPMPQRQKTERVVAALHVFLEQVVIDVPSTVPVSVPYKLKLAAMRDAFTPFIGSGEDAARCEGILALVSASASAAGIETEQEREQEQEQQQEQQREQEVEIERYQDLAYVREGEEPTRWPFCQLAEFRGAARQPAPLAEGAFYPASEFCVRGKSPLTFPPYLAVSRNHFNLEWRGERRLKNAVMVLEWCPSSRPSKSSRHAWLSRGAQRSGSQGLNLLDVDGSGDLSRQELIATLHSADDWAGARTVTAKAGSPLSELTQPELSGLLAESEESDALSFDKVSEILTSGRMRTEHTGRYFVLLSLAEAETIRCIMHLREGPLIPGSDVAMALRCVAAHDAVFDRVAPVSTRAKTTPAYQAHVSHDCFRFIDGNMHFKPAELNVILRSIPELPMRRCLFFKLTIACRRRLFKDWRGTALAKLFTLEDEWSMLKQRAQAVRLREAIKLRGWRLYDAPSGASTRTMTAPCRSPRSGAPSRSSRSTPRPPTSSSLCGPSPTRASSVTTSSTSCSTRRPRRATSSSWRSQSRTEVSLASRVSARRLERAERRGPSTSSRSDVDGGEAGAREAAAAAATDGAPPQPPGLSRQESAVVPRGESELRKRLPRRSVSRRRSRPRSTRRRRTCSGSTPFRASAIRRCRLPLAGLRRRAIARGPVRAPRELHLL